MHISKPLILLSLMLCSAVAVRSQECRTSISVGYRVNSTVVDTVFMENGIVMRELSEYLSTLRQDSTVRLIGVTFRGSASPEGSYQLNRRLARRRLQSLEEAVRREFDLPDSLITREEGYIAWDYLSSRVSSSDRPYRDTVLSILSQESVLVSYSGRRQIDRRIPQLQSLYGGAVWKDLSRLYFKDMRNSSVVFVTYRLSSLPPVVSGVAANRADVLRSPYSSSLVRPRPQDPSFPCDVWTRGLHLKTNALLWGLAISNIGLEIDLARHWSFSLPVSYSALNYFTPTVKFRTLSVRPEFRYWFDASNRNFFVGAHFGYAQYNVAVGGDYRYQDHSGVSPALGGGVSVGFRMPLSDDGRWHIGFVLGVGAYSLHYDRFYNVPDGRLFDTTRRTYFGIDNVSVDLSYRFSLNRRRR